jgi:hypothetical protein
MPFQPGQSGNPAGRPRGARNKTTILLEDFIERDGEALTRQFIEQAKAGNARALSCLMGIVLPKRKGAPIEIDLPPLEQASDVPVAICRDHCGGLRRRAHARRGDLAHAHGRGFSAGNAEG